MFNRKEHYQKNRARILSKAREYYREHRDQLVAKKMVNHTKLYNCNKEYREKTIARSIAGQRTKLAKTCVVCGSLATDRHHPDYAKPRFIASVCRRCHKQLHKE